MPEILSEIANMLDQGRNPLDISAELNVPSAWVQYAIEDRIYVKSNEPVACFD